nr:MAG TPA: hypothetical protein [Caudoviricetes sp.]
MLKYKVLKSTELSVLFLFYPQFRKRGGGICD